MTIAGIKNNRGLKTTALLIVALLISLFLWDTILLYPLRLLVVLVHESGHAAAAVLTGGKVLGIKIAANESGLATTAGGSRFIILNAGYLTSALFGAVLLRLIGSQRSRKFVLEGLGVLLIIVGVIWVRDLFTWAFCGAISAVLIFLGVKASEQVETFTVGLIATTSSLYALFDIRSDVLSLGAIASNAGVSDAAKLAEMTGIPGIIWGGAWIALSAFAMYKALRGAIRKSSEEEQATDPLAGNL
jgi:Peptidase M50B-like